MQSNHFFPHCRSSWAQTTCILFFHPNPPWQESCLQKKPLEYSNIVWSEFLHHFFGYVFDMQSMWLFMPIYQLPLRMMRVQVHDDVRFWVMASRIKNLYQKRSMRCTNDTGQDKIIFKSGEVLEKLILKFGHKYFVF